jgi:thermitase
MGRTQTTLVGLFTAMIAAMLMVAGVTEAQEEHSQPNVTEESGTSNFAKDSSGGSWTPSERDSEMLRPDNKAEDRVPQERRVDEDPEGNPYVAGELNVVYKQTAGTQAVEEVQNEIDAQVVTNLPEINSQTLSFPEVKSLSDEESRERTLKATKEELESDPTVEAVGYNYIGEMQATPNDPLLDGQWGLSRINAFQAWDTTLGNNALISIIDSGIALDHPDVVGKAVAGYDYLRNDPSPNDETGHGTHVAGIAAAFTNNGIGVAGTSPNSPIIVQKVCTSGATGCPFNITNTAIREAADYVNPTYGRVKVINLSLGGFGYDPQQEAAVDYARSKGVVVVAAAGNEASNQPFYPGAFENSIAVSGVDMSNGDSDFSNYGTWVDVAAPGGEGPPPSAGGGCGTDADDILSTYTNVSGYAGLCGTSMASPFVAGVAGLLASQGRNASEIRSRLESTATDLGAPGKDELFGFGMVNAQAAISGGGGGTCENNSVPAISRLNPGPGAKIRDTSPTIKATVTDRQHVLSKSNITFSLDGKTKSRFSYSGRTGRLIYRAKHLKPGKSHTAKIVATDPCGGWSSKTWRFTVRK